MWSSHISVLFPNKVFPSDLSTEILYAPLLYPKISTCSFHHNLLDLITSKINLVRNAEYEVPYYAVFSIPLSASPSSAKHTPHRIFEHPQPTFISNVKETLELRIYNFYIFRQKTGRRSILDRMIISIWNIQSALTFMKSIRIFMFISWTFII